MPPTLLPSINSTLVSTVQPDRPASVATQQNPAPSNLSAGQTEVSLVKQLWSKRTTAVGRTITALTLLCTILGLWVAFSGTKAANSVADIELLLSKWTADVTFYEFCESVSPRLHPNCRGIEPSRHELIFRRRVGIVQAAMRPRTTPLGGRLNPILRVSRVRVRPIGSITARLAITEGRNLHFNQHF